MADSNLDTALGTASLAWILMRYPSGLLRRSVKRVRVSCKLSKGSDWMEAEMKRIRDSHQDVWGHDHKIVRTKQKCALADDHSLEMRGMATRTDQILCIAEATGSKIYTRESKAEAQG